MGARVLGQRDAGTDADLEDAPAIRSASLLDAGNRRAPASLEHRAEHDIIDRRPQRIGARNALFVDVCPHTRNLSARCVSGYPRRQPRDCGGLDRAFDETTAEHARLPFAGVVEYAGLSWRHSLLAVDEFDLITRFAVAQPGRLWRSRRPHLDEHFAPVIGERFAELAIADPVDVAQ